MATFKSKRKELNAMQEELARLHEQAQAISRDVRAAQEIAQGRKVEAVSLQKDLDDQEVSHLSRFTL
jgi:predicted  nucleic acid-binding Zn-ribbon protein